MTTSSFLPAPAASRPLYAGGTVAMNVDWADSGVLRATEGGEGAKGNYHAL